MAFNVPLGIDRGRGTTSVSAPSIIIRRSLTWSPFWLTTKKPNRSKIANTFSPERTLSFTPIRNGWEHGRQFKARQDRRYACKTQRGWLFAIEEQLDGFADIILQFLESRAERHDRCVDALGSIAAGVARDIELKYRLHMPKACNDYLEVVSLDIYSSMSRKIYIVELCLCLAQNGDDRAVGRGNSS